MSAITPFGDSLEGFLSALLEGKSAIAAWERPEYQGLLSKVGGDLAGYDIENASLSLSQHLPPYSSRRLSKLLLNSPWVTRITVLCAAQAYRDAGLFDCPVEKNDIAVIIAGHNMNNLYKLHNWKRFHENRSSIDASLAVKELDSDQAGCVSEVLGLHGALYTVGGACASGSVAIRAGMDEIRHHGAAAALIICPLFDISPDTLQSLAMIRAISVNAFDNEPQRASRPFDADRNGFVPCQGAGAIVIEDMSHAGGRRARVHAEILSAEINSHASRNPNPSEESESQVMRSALLSAGIDPSEIDFISAHATSTQLGDRTEIRAIKNVFGNHADRLRINAPKSMLGHTLTSSALLETIADRKSVV